jgi:HEAT repeat protein
MRGSRAGAFLLSLSLSAALGSLSLEGHALPPPKAAKPSGTPLPKDAVKRLKSGDDAQVKAALDDVRMSAKDGAAAVPAVVDLLKQGLPPPLTLAAIETLGDTENDGASEVLSWYTHHRDPALRRAAVSAVAKTHGATAAKTLRASLSDPDPGVRGLSATALGTLKAKDAVPDLFVALDHKVSEAAASIGQLCADAQCDKLAGKLGSVPFDVVTSGLDEVLFRPAADVNDDQKVKIVGRIRELGTAEANRFLKEVQGKWPPGWSQRVKQAVDQAVLATASSPGSAGSSGGAQ